MSFLNFHLICTHIPCIILKNRYQIISFYIENHFKIYQLLSSRWSMVCQVTQQFKKYDFSQEKYYFSYMTKSMFLHICLRCIFASWLEVSLPRIDINFQLHVFFWANIWTNSCKNVNFLVLFCVSISEVGRWKVSKRRNNIYNSNLHMKQCHNISFISEICGNWKLNQSFCVTFLTCGRCCFWIRTHFTLFITEYPI